MFTFNKNQIWYLILPIAVFFSFYFALGSYPLLNNNDGIYASIAKYTLLNKNFVIPYLNCVPYLEKPPLLYWLLSLSFFGLGFTAFAARFVTVTTAALICLAIIYFTNKIKQTKVGFLASLIFASSIGISIMARMIYFDMLFTFLLSTNLFCLFYWYETKKTNILRMGYIFFGLAILAKGLLAIVFTLGIFGIFLILEKNLWKTLRSSLDLIGIIFLLTIILPWHIAATIQNKNFFWNYIIGEHFLRFLNLREPHDYYNGPIYYYLPRIIAYLFPWSFFIPLAFLHTKSKEPIEKKLLQFCWCWPLVPLAFFSLSSAKANYYMLVSMPALAIILGLKLNSLFTSKYKKIFNVLVSIILVLIALCITSCFYNFLAAFPTIIAHKKLIIITIIYILTSALTCLVFVQHTKVATIALASLIFPIVITITTVLKENSDNVSSAQTGIYLEKFANNKQIYLYQDFEKFSAVSFYANTCFKIIDTKSNDLYYGSQQEQFKHLFLTNKEFLRKTKNKQFYVVVPTNKLKQFYHNTNLKKTFIVQKTPTLTILATKQKK